MRRYWMIAMSAAAILASQSVGLAETYTWDGTTDSNWTNGPQDNTSGTVFPANGAVGSNWTVLSSGLTGQLAVPDPNFPSGNLINYFYTDHDFVINNADGTTLPVISEDTALRIGGGTVTVTNSTVSILPTSATTTATLAGINIGQSGNPTTASFTDSTINIGRSNNSGRAFGVLSGSTLDLVNTDLNAFAEAGTGSIDINSTSTVTMDANSSVTVSGALAVLSNEALFTMQGGTINADHIRLNANGGTSQDILFDFQGGAVTVSSDNGLRGNAFEGSFDWTGAAGSGTVTHTDLTGAFDAQLAGKVADGFFSIEGTRINPVIAPNTDWTVTTNLDALNAELESLLVNSKFLKVTNTGTEHVLTIEAAAIIEWLTDTDSSWSSAANWSSDPVLPGATDDVLFNALTFTDVRTVDVDTAVVVNKLTVGGTNQITFDDLTSGSLDVNEYNVTGGTHVFAASLAGGATTKSGGGTMLLTADNSGFSGDVTISEGTIQITDPNQIGTGALTVNGTLLLEDGFDATISNTITGTGQLTVDLLQTDVALDIETANFTGNTGFTGNITVVEGVLNVDSAADLGNATGTTNIAGSTGVLQIDGSGGNITSAENIQLGTRAGNNFAGAELLAHVRNEAGDNVLTGAMTTTGASFHNIELKAGSLAVSNTSGAPATITTDDGTLRIFGAGDMKIGNEADPGAGKLLGTGNVLKQGAGTLTIATATAVNGDYNTGEITVEAGTLEILSDGTLDQGELLNSKITINSGATFDVDDFGTYFIQPNQELTGAGTVVANTVAFLEASVVTPGDSIGTLDITGNMNLLYFDSDETTVPNTGSLNYELGAATTTGDTIDVTGNLDITVATPATDKFAVNVQPVEGTLAAGSYRLINYAGSLTGNGSGTNFTATAVDNQGNTLTTRAALTVSTATANQVNLSVSASSASLHWVGDNTGVWDVNSGTDFSIDGDDGTGEDVFFDLDNVTFGDNAAVKTVSISNPVAPGSMTINNSAGNDYEFTGANVSGFGGLTKNGTGTATLRNQTSYSGDTNVNAGTLVIAGQHINAGHTLNVASGATLQVGDGTSAGNIGSAYTVDVTAGGTLEIVDDDGNFSSILTGAGTVNVNETARFAGDTTTFTGTLNQLSGNLDISDNAENFNAATTINLNGGGMNVFPGANNRTLNVTFNAIEGNVRVGNTDASLVFAGQVNVTDTATTFQTDGDSEMVLNGDLDLGAGANLIMQAGADIADGRGTSINGNVTGSGTLTKTGAGELQLNGTANTYTGNTNIDEGTLIVGAGSSLGASAVINVNEGGTLDVTANGGLTLSGQTLNNNSSTTVIGDVNATGGSTVSGNGVFENDLSASGSTVQVGAATIGLVVDSGLIARHNFEPGSETLDSSTNSNDVSFGASASATLATAAVGTGAASFDDVDDDNGNRITVDGFKGIKGDAARTHTFWLKAPATQESGATIIGIGDPDTTHRFDIRYQEDNVRVEIAGAGSQFTGGSGSAIFDDTWHHVAVTFPDGGTFFDIEMFIDGVSIGGPDGSNDIALDTNVGDLDVLYGDSNFNQANRNLDGLIDDVQWYNKVLTPTEIADIFNNPGNVASSSFVLVPETMTVNGNYSQDATSTLQVDLVDTTDFDKLAVGGTASLDGGLDLDFEAAELTLGDEAVILTSTGLTGHFDNAQVTGHELTAVANTAVATLYEGNDVRLLATYQGDANGDKKVSLLDLNALGVGFGITGTATWQDGDFNYDGDVSLLDLNALGVTFGNEIVAPGNPSAPAVPEPASLVLLGLGALALSRKRRG